MIAFLLSLALLLGRTPASVQLATDCSPIGSDRTTFYVDAPHDYAVWADGGVTVTIDSLTRSRMRLHVDRQIDGVIIEGASSQRVLISRPGQRSFAATLPRRDAIRQAIVCYR